MRRIFGFLLILLGSSGYDSVMAQSTGFFTATGNLTTPRFAHSATLLTTGKVLIAGGATSGPLTVTLASAELYDPSTGTFSVTGDMTMARMSHTATLLPNGKVLIAGGVSNFNGSFNNSSALASAELYDPSAGTFTSTGNMTAARTQHTATLLNDGKVLLARGVGPSAELYDSSTETFGPTANMTTARCEPPPLSPNRDTATLLQNGKVLIVPGDDEACGDYASADLYDPETGRFGPTGRLGWAFTASLLTNGKVLLTLANFDRVGNAAALYDPSNGTFALTGYMSVARGDSTTATLLPDGKVLIVGYDYFGTGVHGDLYDSAAGTFSYVLGSHVGAVNHTATLLPDGTVLLTGGGFGSGGPSATAELYHPAVLAPSPVLFSLSGDGKGPGAILHAGTHQVVSPDNPAVAGEALEIYLTGLTDGSVIPPQVAIGGRMAGVLFFGNAPGFKGLNQVNVRVPSGVAPGAGVPLRLTYLGRPSNAVTIGVQ